jgi:proteasome lid subunit RPN8/RPN11
MIRIAEDAARAIRRHGRRAYPEECCGALFGEAGGGADFASEAEALENARPDERRRRFRIDPGDYRRLERLAEVRGRTLLGFYHSHPDHPAVPSEYDRDHALPVFHYVVLGVASGEPGEMTSWVMSEDRRAFLREEILPEAVGEEE